MLEKARVEAEHPAIPAFSALAAELGVWLLIGSLQIKLDAATCANRSFLFDAQGRIVARYDKIHMFDVDLKGGESYRESKTFQPGERAVVEGTIDDGDLRRNFSIGTGLVFGFAHREHQLPIRGNEIPAGNNGDAQGGEISRSHHVSLDQRALGIGRIFHLAVVAIRAAFEGDFAGDCSGVDAGSVLEAIHQFFVERNFVFFGFES